MAEPQMSDTPAPPAASGGAPAPGSGVNKRRGASGDGYDAQAASVAPGGALDQSTAPQDGGSGLAAILRAAQRERDEPPTPSATMRHGAEVAYRMLDLYHPELASQWAVSGAAGSTSVQGVKLTPAGKNVDVVVGRDFIVATDAAQVATRANELGAAFAQLDAAGKEPVTVALGAGGPVKAKSGGDPTKDRDQDKSAAPAEVLTPELWLAANEANAKRRAAGDWAYNQVQIAFEAPLVYARMSAQNHVTGASQTAQPWSEALGPTSLAIAKWQAQHSITPVTGIADDATLQAAGFTKAGKTWNKLLTTAEGQQADAADAAKLAADVAAAQVIGKDPAQSADGRRGAIVSFARTMCGTVDASNRGDGKKTGGGRIVEIYKTLFGDANVTPDRERDMRGANTFANDSKRAPGEGHKEDWSWCGLFAAYCVKASTGVGGWAAQRPSGMASVTAVSGDAAKFKAAAPQAGDILAISSSNNHLVLLAETPTDDMKGALSCVEGNIEAQGIRESTRMTYANVTHVYKPF